MAVNVVQIDTQYSITNVEDVIAVRQTMNN